jgi:hypothetical protein
MRPDARMYFYSMLYIQMVCVCVNEGGIYIT